MTPVSNGEWCPLPPKREQLVAARMIAEESTVRARRLGMTRAQFLRTAAGTATALMVLNRVHGLDSWGDAAAMPVRREHCEDPAAGRELLDRDWFVMDVQTHHVDLPVFGGRSTTCLLDLRHLVRRLGHTPSDLPCPEFLGQMNFIREVFVGSETDVGVISGLPSGVPMGPGIMAATRDLVNELAGSQRALSQAMIDPKAAPGSPTALDSIEHQVKNLKASALKCYTYNGNWRLDDERVAYPMYERAQKLGLRLVNVHKGLPVGLFPGSPEYVRTTDFPKAVRDWPRLRFCAYHSGHFQIGTHPEGVDGIAEFVQVVQRIPRRQRRRVYAEVGTSFAYMLLDGPDRAAHFIGQLLKVLGSRNILWGTDSIWWGSPQFLIDAFRNLQIPTAMQERFGYPPLTERDKRRILGLNAAALYGVKPRRRRCTIPLDRLARAQDEAGGARAARSLRWFGPQTRRDFLALLRREGRLA
jgi:predicted TIM-barrel fold metal-dependent hydrolase